MVANNNDDPAENEHGNEKSKQQGSLPQDQTRPNTPINTPDKGANLFIGGLFHRPRIVSAARFRVSNFYHGKIEILREMARGEGDLRTPFNWLPVFFGSGCLIYFKSPAEPQLLWLLGTVLVCSLLAWRQVFHGKIFFVLMAFAVVFSGMLAAKLRTNLAATPIIERQTTTRISGLVLSVSQNTRGAPRYLIRPLQAEKIPKEDLPRKIRLSAASKHTPILPGQSISGLARIYPFSGPAYPGGYDFSFNVWFDGIGGTGFFHGKASPFRCWG